MDTQEEEEATEEQEETIRPVNTVMAEVENQMMALIETLDSLQMGEALYHELWPTIANYFDELTRSLLQAGMQVNRDNNPIYQKIQAKVNSLFEE